MRDDSKVIEGNNWRTIISANKGEILVCTGEFYRMIRVGLFVETHIDDQDEFKICGTTKDGKLYVSEKDTWEASDEEFKRWAKRHSVMIDEHMHIATKQESEMNNDRIRNHFGRISL